ncbi:RNase adapter RapZ [Kineosporia rhizophila]|uniref:RNase adapter RapZ n=2 Tax=Kineosporia TaxID=49184 RepID=UPI001E42818C|nr:RNase adapter RapZ [Kineosporia sp. NBRC 101677]MCE0540226.1 RNase adapter RapZ [Kineosporia rhizophila]
MTSTPEVPGPAGPAPSAQQSSTPQPPAPNPGGTSEPVASQALPAEAMDSESMVTAIAQTVASSTHTPATDHDSAASGPGSASELLIITGMSGAGRSTAAKALEDLGWYVVDNLPPQLIAELAMLAATAEPRVRRIAVAVDVRGRSFFSALAESVSTAENSGIRTRLLFLDATNETLVRRFESVRRPHPLQGDGAPLDGIREERRVMGELRGNADTVIDTSRLNVHELASKIIALFGDAGDPAIRILLMSFGFKYGLPLDADQVADVRFLPNPFWVPELRPHNGLDQEVADYVLGQEGAAEFVDRYALALQPVLAGYVRENKRYATIAVGCTGGKHRSVAISELLSQKLEGDGVAVTTVHRDLGRE